MLKHKKPPVGISNFLRYVILHNVASVSIYRFIIKFNVWAAEAARYRDKPRDMVRFSEILVGYRE